MNFQWFFAKPSHGLGVGVWCCFHLNCASPSPIMLGKSQKTWSRWVSHMWNKVFPMLEDKHSSSRSVEQFSSIPGLFSLWGNDAWCFSAESSWAREPEVVVFGRIHGLQKNLIQVTWVLSAATLAKTSWGRNSMWDQALGTAVPLARSRFQQGSISCWNIEESPDFIAEQPLASQVVLLLLMLPPCFILFSIPAAMEVDSAWWIHSCRYSRWFTPLWSQQST